MAEAKIAFDRLNDFNWGTWRFRMELMLMREDLWSTVKDAKPAPEHITSAWTRKDEKARALIGLALEDSQLSHIMDAVNAKDMWDKLKGYHERGSLSNKIHILRKLCSMRLKEDGSMSHHLTEASELVHRFARMGEPLKDHLVVAILLSSLPEAYNPLVTALEGRPEEDLKLDYVKGKLLDEWRRKNEIRIQEDEKAMKSIIHYEDRRGAVWTCYHCGQAGHFKRNCAEWLEERRKAKKQQEKESKMHQDQEPVSGSSSSRGVCFTTTTGSNKSSDERWIIDSGSTKHMTSSTASLGWWNPCAEKVSLADGKTVTARGCGQGRIIGRGLQGMSVEIKVKELLFVPGLSTNVLSVSRITDEGYTVRFGPRDCQIMDGETVIAVGEKSNGLYYLTQ